MIRIFLLAALVGGSFSTLAQPAAGQIRYEVTSRLEVAKFIGLDGVEIKPGSPGYPADLPDVIHHEMSLTFGTAYARENEKDQVVQLQDDQAPPPAEARPARAAKQSADLDSMILRPTFLETTYIGLADRTQIRVLTTVGPDGQKVRYRTTTPFLTPADWRETGRRKTIAGRSCREARATSKGTAYTVWFTTELPFTYSPISEVAPPAGVVLKLESERVQYVATRLEAQTLDETTLLPPTDARLVGAEELAEVRKKAEADFTQRLLDQVK